MTAGKVEIKLVWGISGVAITEIIGDDHEIVLNHIENLGAQEWAEQLPFSSQLMQGESELVMGYVTCGGGNVEYTLESLSCHDLNDKRETAEEWARRVLSMIDEITIVPTATQKRALMCDLRENLKNIAYSPVCKIWPQSPIRLEFPLWVDGLSVRVATILIDAGFKSIKDVSDKLRDGYDFTTLPNFGSRCMTELNLWHHNNQASGIEKLNELFNK